MYRVLLSENRQYLYRAARDSDMPVRQWMDKLLADKSFHDFDEAIGEELGMILAGNSTPEPSYVRRGLYHEQISRYLAYFDRKSILVIDSGSLMREPSSILDQVTEFLGLPSHNWSCQELPLVHVLPYQREMSEKTRVLLQGFYRPHNERLCELLGRDFGWE
jgi:hypothetical protein